MKILQRFSLQFETLFYSKKLESVNQKSCEWNRRSQIRHNKKENVNSDKRPLLLPFHCYCQVIIIIISSANVCYSIPAYWSSFFSVLGVNIEVVNLQQNWQKLKQSSSTKSAKRQGNIELTYYTLSGKEVSVRDKQSRKHETSRKIGKT